MKHLFVIDNLSSGGAQKQMTDLAIELRRRGHEIDVFVYHSDDFFGDRLRRAGVNICLHPKKSRYSMATIWSLRQQLRAGNYDAVLSHLHVQNLYSIVARWFMRSAPPLVVSELCCHAPEVWGYRKELIQKMYWMADRVVANSHHMREDYWKRYPSLKSRVLTIWNGYDMAGRYRYEFPPPRSPSLKLLCIGRLEPYKNWCCVVDAIDLLHRQYGIDVTVSHVGRIESHLVAEQETYAHLRSRLSEKHLTDNWLWMGERQDVPELISQHHAVVHPSYVEGLPNAVCESLCCGRPAVACSLFDNPRLIDHGKTGYLCQPRDPESLAEVVFELAQLTDDGYQAMCCQARSFAETHLSVTELGDRYEEMFADLCSRAT